VVAPNVFEPEFEPEDSDREGFAHRGAWISHQAGAEQLGASLYEIGAGQANCPYHWHAANEELLIVLRGTVTLRTPDGEQELGAGETVAFPRGEAGAHQMINRTDQPVRFLVLSEMRRPDVPVYPDSGKVGVREVAPGSGQEGLRLNFRAGDAVDYWEGEEPPGTVS
jgi:uncharacterized cupin superfamily protein